MLKIVTDGRRHRDDLRRMLDDLVSEGARRMLMAGLEAEVAAYVEWSDCEELVDVYVWADGVHFRSEGRPGGTQRQSWGADAGDRSWCAEGSGPSGQ